MRAWLVHEFGVPTDVLRLDEVDALEPGPDEVQIAVEAITINFNDIDVETFRCMAFGRRHLLVGFASGIEAEDEGIVPRPVLFGNFSLVGACHAYTEDSLAFKRATGLNFLSHADGVRLHEELLRMIAAGTIRPIAGSTSSFSALPEIVGAMESRATIGRNVVIVD